MPWTRPRPGPWTRLHLETEAKRGVTTLGVILWIAACCFLIQRSGNTLSKSWKYNMPSREVPSSLPQMSCAMSSSDRLPNKAPTASVPLPRSSSVDAAQVNRGAISPPHNQVPIAQLHFHPRSAELLRARFLPALIAWPWQTQRPHNGHSIADSVQPPVTSPIWERWTKVKVGHSSTQPATSWVAVQAYSGLYSTTAQSHLGAGRVGSTPGAILRSMLTVRSDGPTTPWFKCQAEPAAVRVASAPTRRRHHHKQCQEQHWWHSGSLMRSIPLTALVCTQPPCRSAGAHTPRTHQGPRSSTSSSGYPYKPYYPRT